MQEEMRSSFFGDSILSNVTVEWKKKWVFVKSVFNIISYLASRPKSFCSSDRSRSAWSRNSVHQLLLFFLDWDPIMARVVHELNRWSSSEGLRWRCPLWRQCSHVPYRWWCSFPHNPEIRDYIHPLHSYLLVTTSAPAADVSCLSAIASTDSSHVYSQVVPKMSVSSPRTKKNFPDKPLGHAASSGWEHNIILYSSFTAHSTTFQS